MFQTFCRCALAAHCQHLQHAFLCAVVAVLGTAFALGNPDVLFLLVDGVVHVAAHQLAAFHQFSRAEPAAHGECLVQLHQLLYPRINEQIVADGNLAGSGEFGIGEKEVQDGAVQHNVAVVADKGEALVARRNAGVVKGHLVGAFVRHILYHGLHEAHLEVECAVHADEGCADDEVAHSLRKPGHQPFQYAAELAVVEQLFHHLLYLVIVIGTYLVKFRIHVSLIL